ncbi:MAG: alpha-hydroxy-acid oxidizing protein [Pseudomonadota bacterium]
MTIFSNKKHKANYGDLQGKILFKGVPPNYPVSYAELLERAKEVMPSSIMSHVHGGSGDELTQNRNVAAFASWGMVPRMLVGCAERDLSINLFDCQLPNPIFMSPIGGNCFCTSDNHGDIAAAKASAIAGVPFAASLLANDPLEDVIEHCEDVPAWFQLYVPRHRELAESFVSRAEQAGYKALVLTLDMDITGWRPCDLRTAHYPQGGGVALKNYFVDPVFRGLLRKTPEDDASAAVNMFRRVFGEPLTWEHVAWLREFTSLPIVLKGICHADDARRAVDMGVDAIFCSNHGGRQANGGIAAIDLLPEVVDAAGDTPVLFDSGVRSGVDIIKAIALGAAAVGIGRPYTYGLAIDGAAGAAHVLRCLLAEADLMMAVNGYPSLADVRAAGARRVP